LLVRREEYELQESLFTFIDAFSFKAGGDRAVEIAILPDPIDERPG
jgi:hypothetical protein